jgi:hypothetical protein
MKPPVVNYIAEDAPRNAASIKLRDASMFRKDDAIFVQSAIGPCKVYIVTGVIQNDLTIETIPEQKMRRARFRTGDVVMLAGTTHREGERIA